MDLSVLWSQRPTNLKRLYIEGLLSADAIESFIRCEGLETLEELTLRPRSAPEMLELIKRLKPATARGLVEHWHTKHHYAPPTFLQYLDALPPTLEGATS